MYLCFVNRQMYIFISICVTQVRAPPWHRAAETTRRVNYVYGSSVAKENTVRFWLQRFRSANIDLQTSPVDSWRPKLIMKN